jgi:hypothetical protein
MLHPKISKLNLIRDMYLLIQNNNQSYNLAGEDTRFSPEMPGSSLGDLYEFNHSFRFPDIFSNSNTGPSKLGVNICPITSEVQKHSMTNCQNAYGFFKIFLA